MKKIIILITLIYLGTFEAKSQDMLSLRVRAGSLKQSCYMDVDTIRISTPFYIPGGFIFSNCSSITIDSRMYEWVKLFKGVRSNFSPINCTFLEYKNKNLVTVQKSYCEKTFCFWDSVSTIKFANIKLSEQTERLSVTKLPIDSFNGKTVFIKGIKFPKDTNTFLFYKFAVKVFADSSKKYLFFSVKKHFFDELTDLECSSVTNEVRNGEEYIGSITYNSTTILEGVEHYIMFIDFANQEYLEKLFRKFN